MNCSWCAQLCTSCFMTDTTLIITQRPVDTTQTLTSLYGPHVYNFGDIAIFILCLVEVCQLELKSWLIDWLIDFLLVIIELFFARCFRFVTIHAFDRQTDRRTYGHTDRQTLEEDRGCIAAARHKNGRFITACKVRSIVHDTYITAKINFINSGPYIYAFLIMSEYFASGTADVTYMAVLGL